MAFFTANYLAGLFSGWFSSGRTVVIEQNVVIGMDVTPVYLGGFYTGIAVTKRVRPLQILRNGSSVFGQQVTTAFIPPLLIQLDSSAYDSTMDNTITLNGYNFLANALVTIGPIAVLQSDVAITDPTTATIQYYANSIAAGTYNLFWQNADGGQGVMQIIFI